MTSAEEPLESEQEAAATQTEHHIESAVEPLPIPAQFADKEKPNPWKLLTDQAREQAKEMIEGIMFGPNEPGEHGAWDLSEEATRPPATPEAERSQLEELFNHIKRTTSEQINAFLHKGKVEATIAQAEVMNLSVKLASDPELVEAIFKAYKAAQGAQYLGETISSVPGLGDMLSSTGVAEALSSLPEAAEPTVEMRSEQSGEVAQEPESSLNEAVEHVENALRTLPKTTERQEAEEVEVEEDALKLRDEKTGEMVESVIITAAKLVEFITHKEGIDEVATFALLLLPDEDTGKIARIVGACLATFQEKAAATVEAQIAISEAVGTFDPSQQGIEQRDFAIIASALPVMANV